MAISNLERRIRFSNNFSVQEYRDLAQEYRNLVTPMLAAHDTKFQAALETAGDGSEFILPKAKIEKMAEALVLDTNVYRANLGKSILHFMTTKEITLVYKCIEEIFTVGGDLFESVYQLIMSFIGFAITVLPAKDLSENTKCHEQNISSRFSDYWDRKFSKHMTTYLKMVENIAFNNDKGIPSVHDLMKAVTISGELDNYVANYIHPDTTYDDATINDCCSIIQAINSRLFNPDNKDYDVMDFQLTALGEISPIAESTQFGTNSIMESMELLANNDYGYQTMEAIVEKPMLSTKGLFHGIISIVSESYEPDLLAKFIKCYENTAKYEMTHESFRDFPLMKVTNAILEYTRNRCKGNHVLMENIQTLEETFNSANSLVYDEIKEEMANGGPNMSVAPSTSDVGFVPDPYSIGSLTPFPVADRRVGSLLVDIVRAETDDEITEAMLNFSRVETVINEHYEVTGNEKEGYLIMEGLFGKAARKAETKANEKFSKIATRDKSGGIKEAIKRTLDPMEKWIEKKWDEFKEKDAAERREIILKGGVWPKVMRWIKRGIKLLIGGMVGTVIPPVAIISGIIFIGRICTDKYLDNKERAKILRELEDEIMICNEKIEDSRGDDDKQKKYELMRIRNQLQRTSEKIRLGLRY